MREMNADDCQKISGSQLEFSPAFFIGSMFAIAVVGLMVMERPKKTYNPIFLDASTTMDAENDIFDSYGHYKPNPS